MKDLKINQQEEAYRRGFSHGVLASENGVTVSEAYEWRNADENTCPPGTPWAGRKLESCNKYIKEDSNDSNATN